ncbi:class I adenylate-forming enzyme family protein [Amycolatopsis sp.]|uniref:class I adenylate-forming enzyme family protein n=1 Tax=Amycolatopsis sp. TaxID=37632 RepID=UPI002C2AC11E|nr:class I adenylate-forming enzyme family protein [Amycolatopsis sp.]HVV11247.1 class I adenylate-forming enzyme family protein [Amycolatopsis sp.]
MLSEPAGRGPAWGREVVTEPVGGRPSPVYRDRRRSVAEMLLDGRRRPDRVHVVQDGYRLTFAQHEQAVIRAAKWLREHGVERGDRVMLLCRNRLELGITYWAGHLLGAVVVLGNAWWSVPEAAGLIGGIGPRLVVVDDEAADRVPEGVGSAGITEVTPLLSGDDPGEFPLPGVAEDDPALVLFTAGSTGTPKGTVLSQRSVVNNMQNLLGTARRLPPELPADHRGSVSLMTVPLFHLAGVQVLTSPLLTGGRLVYQAGRFRPAEVLRLIEQERVQTWGAVPAMVVRLMEHEDFARHDLSSLRSIGLGGSASPPGFNERVRRAFPNLKGGGAGSLYGMTETGGLLAMGSAKELASRPGAVGKLLPVAQIRIVDPDEQGAGEILARSPGLMSGFLPEAPSPVDEDGWLHTGDRGWVSEDRYLYLSGRSKEIIIRGGENIACARVEEALTGLPGVVEAAALPLPHAELGEQVGAVVVLRKGATATAEELRAQVTGELAKFQVPTRWWIRSELLPTSPQGKVLRAQLLTEWTDAGGADRDEVAAGAAR